MGKGILTGLILLLCAFCAQAQNTMPVSQSPPDKSVPLLFEKTYLHTDRDVYAQGDTLWFKAYLVNGQDNKPVNSSGTLYVELLAPDSAKIIDHEIIRLDNGLGNGDFALTDTLKAGNYRLRAYTNWMRNFGDNFIFEKSIALLDIQSIPVAPDPKVPANVKNRVKGKTAIVPTATQLLPLVRFYPEGGSLVQGISSLVAVKAEDGYGKGMQASGVVLSSAGDTVSHFHCDSFGLGLFVLLPIKNLTYRAVMDIGDGMPGPPAGGRHDVFQLPAALSKGLTLRVKQTDSVIHAVVNAISDNVMMTAANHPLNVDMAVKHSGKTILSRELTLEGTQIAFKLGTAALPEGISAITIYDNEGKPECERLVYIHHPDIKNTLTITADKKNYQSKEKVIVSVNAPANSSLSMAVVDASIVPEQADDIVSYLQLQSEVKGNIENPNRYFDTVNVNRFKQLDLLLMTQGWRDFVWRRLTDTAIRISYAAENGITVSGRIRDEVLNKMLPGLDVSLYAQQAKGLKLFDMETDSLGRFHFDRAMLYGKQTVTLSAVNEKGEKKGSFMVDTLLPLPIAKTLPRYQNAMPAAADSVAIAAIEKRSSLQRSKLSGVTRLKEVSIKAKSSMITRNGSLLTSWGPDQLFNIKPEDEQYKTLEWYILQHAKGAVKTSLYYQQGVGYTTTPVISNAIPYPALPVTGLFFFGNDTLKRVIYGPDGPIVLWQSKTKLIPPQLVVNGQELYMDEFNQAEAYRNIYFNMAITKFKRIVIKRMVGNLHGPGIPVGAQNISVDRFFIYLTLKDNALVDNPGSTNADLEGYYQARTFYSPPPNAKPSLADYRTTIYWEPNIKTDATGKANVSFYNAIPQTNVQVIVQGVTDTGIPLVASANYEVK